MAVFLNKNSFCRICILPLFCIKTNPRENRFFLRQGALLVDYKPLIMLKFMLKSGQKWGWIVYKLRGYRVSKLTNSQVYAFTRW